MTYPAIRGDVLAPTAMTAPESSSAHGYYNVIRDLIRRVGYHNENQVLTALQAVDAHEKHQVSQGDLRLLANENEPAPYEDVSKRTPPAGYVAPVPAGPAIDYNALAAALVAAQQQAQPPADSPAE